MSPHPSATHSASAPAAELALAIMDEGPSTLVAGLTSPPLLWLIPAHRSADAGRERRSTQGTLEDTKEKENDLFGQQLLNCTL